MPEASEAKGLKIVRPGLNYYFDGDTPRCPMCQSPDLEYRCRVRETPRTAQFKCTACQCKFEKTRTLATEPEGYAPPIRSADAVFALSCRECNAPLDMKVGDFEKAERITCGGCGAVVKSRTGEQA